MSHEVITFENVPTFSHYTTAIQLLLVSSLLPETVPRQVAAATRERCSMAAGSGCVGAACDLSVLEKPTIESDPPGDLVRTRVEYSCSGENCLPDDLISTIDQAVSDGCQALRDGSSVSEAVDKAIERSL